MMGSTLESRIRVCEDESLVARVAQALLEVGKKAPVESVVASIVAASRAVGVDAEVSSKELGPAISDEEIIAYVAALV